MALITQAAIQNPMFRTIDETLYYQIPPTNLCDEPRDLWHQLKMLYSSSPYYYEYCEGGKTGYTDQAHNTLTTYAEKNGIELICVMMNCQGAANCYLDSASLYEYYFNNYTYVYPLESFQPNTTNQSDYILNNFYQGLNHDTLQLSVDSDLAILVPLDTDASAITTNATYYDTISGNVVGNVEVYYNGTLVGQSDITYSDITVNGEVLSWGAVQEEHTKLFRKLLLILVGCFVLFILVLFVIAQIRNRRYRYLKRRNKSNKLHF
jgi:D-alanyl-D-alanine carboxypeptidase